MTIGLLAGIGLGIIVDQLPVAMGMPKHGGGVIAGIADMVTSVDEINPWALAAAGIVLFCTLGAGLISPRLPGALFGLAAAMVFSAAIDLRPKGVVTLPRPDLAPPNLDFAAPCPGAAVELLPTALVIAVLIVIQTGATEASFPGPRRTIDRDLGAIGIAAAVSGLVGAFAVNASPARTSVVAAAKGRSQVVGLVAAGTATVQVPGVLVWSVEAPLWYADSDFVVTQLSEELSGGGPYAAVVLDAAAIADVDFTGVVALESIIDALDRAQLPLTIARANRSVQNAVDKAGLAGRVTIEPTVADAVKHAADLVGLDDELRAVRGKRKDLAVLRRKGLAADEVIEQVEEELEAEKKKEEARELERGDREDGIVP